MPYSIEACSLPTFSVNGTVRLAKNLGTILFYCITPLLWYFLNIFQTCPFLSILPMVSYTYSLFMKDNANLIMVLPIQNPLIIPQPSMSYSVLLK